MELNESVESDDDCVIGEKTIEESFRNLQDYCTGLHEQKNEIEQNYSTKCAENSRLIQEKTVLEEEVCQLKEQLLEVTRSKKDLQDHMDTAVFGQGSAQSKYEQLANTIQQLEDDLEGMTLERDALKVKMEGLKSERGIDRKPVETDEDSSDDESKLNDQLQHLRDENSQILSKNDELIEQLKRAQDREENLERRVNGMSSIHSVSENDIFNEKSNEELELALKEHEEIVRILEEKLHKTGGIFLTSEQDIVDKSATAAKGGYPSYLVESLLKLSKRYSEIESEL